MRPRPLAGLVGSTPAAGMVRVAAAVLAVARLIALAYPATDPHAYVAAAVLLALWCVGFHAKAMIGYRRTAALLSCGEGGLPAHVSVLAAKANAGPVAAIVGKTPDFPLAAFDFPFLGGTILISPRIAEYLSPAEIRAAVAHEVAHVAARDSGKSTACFVAAAAGLAAAAHAGWAPLLAAACAANLLLLLRSRRCELRADATAARLCGDRALYLAALRKIIGRENGPAAAEPRGWLRRLRPFLAGYPSPRLRFLRLEEAARRDPRTS